MAKATKVTKSSPAVVIHWFRKGLRVHDNPALNVAIKYSEEKVAVLRPIFILDNQLPLSYRIGANRYRFLVESLIDLDKSLKSLGSRLYVVRGQVESELENIFKTWNVQLITYEHDNEPYSRKRDPVVYKLAEKYKVDIKGSWSHTLYEPSVLLQKNNNIAPRTMQKFLDVVSKAGKPPSSLPSCKYSIQVQDPLLLSSQYDPPTLQELKVQKVELGESLYPGGETAALERLKVSLSSKSYVENFAKPNTSPNSLQPSTTVLSPYLKFGCLSARLFYEHLMKFEKSQKTKPPVSLLGQLYWREFYYLVGAATANFTQIEGNSICLQIKWDDNPELFEAWKYGRTGYPFIDAIMTQLRTEGWIHHLARHAVACFLTRGDLWQSWEKGQEVFEEWLLDADVYLNAGNWMWLSASAFFHQYFRVYSPVKFGMKTDPRGDYIRKYLPQLAKYPKNHIYEPWKAPLSVQKSSGCIIGEGYPQRIVDHDTIVKINLKRMGQFYQSKKALSSEEAKRKEPVAFNNDGDGEFDEDHEQNSASSSAKKGFDKLFPKSKRRKM